jgi:hypothetical protein
MAKVYVSSTYLDLKAERASVTTWLIAANHQPVHSYTPDTETVRESCLQDVDSSDIYVLILGHRYGAIPPDDNPESLSITHLEYRRARNRKIPIVALFRTSIPTVSLSDIYTPDQLARVKAFRDEVGHDLRPGEFSTSEELVLALSTGVQKYTDVPRHPTTERLLEALRRASNDLLTWRTTLPNNQWIDRPEIASIEELVETTTKSAILLLGEPGCGKSALLARIGKYFETKSIPVLALKLDFLPDTVKDVEGLRAYLDFPLSLVECVRQLAQKGKVAVLFDQIDALADLVVQHSSRLRVPLDLIRDLSQIENVHVIASCRSFEHRHDPRLRNLEATPITLSLPLWEQIDPILRQHGIHTSSWNESMRADLRSPHVLDTFLRLVKTIDEADLLRGYQHMLGTLWTQAVATDATGGRRRLLFDLAEAMAEREVLWLPVALFEERLSTIHALESAGIILVDDERIGFRHQTLFEFVRARSFIDAAGRLTAAVTARQGSLRIRPQLWHALGYMRAVDSTTYTDELRQLWDTPLRPHLRMLVVEFLGKLQDPSPLEISLLLDPHNDLWLNARVLPAVIGSRGWFEALTSGHLQAIMVQSPQEAWRAEPILEHALVFDPSTVFHLVDTYWLPDPSKDSLTWQLLQAAPEWTVEVVDRADRILTRSAISGWHVNHLVGVVSIQLPAEAPRLVATWLERKWKAPLDSATSDEPCTVEVDQARLLKDQKTSRARALLGTQELHDLPAVAEAAPVAFLNAIWPHFFDFLEAGAGEAHPFVVGYRDETIYLDDFDDDEAAFRRERPLIAAIVRAIQQSAKEHTEAFLAFLAIHQTSDLSIVQRLFAKGLCHVSETHPSRALEFLTSDPRRLVLGSHSDVHRNSKELISALVPHLSEEERRRLEEELWRWKRYSGRQEDDDLSIRHRRLKWEREHRLRLLTAFPRDLMTPESRRRFDEECRAFPNVHDHDFHISGMSPVVSPVSANQMAVAKDAHLLNLFTELTDAHGWDHPREWKKGGAIQAGRELGNLAEKDPQRAVSLIRQLRPRVNEIPVGDVVESLAKTDYDRKSLYALILELSDAGFDSDHFRTACARAMGQVVSAEFPAPEALLQRIEGWMRPTIHASEDDDDDKETDWTQLGSMLWGLGGISILPAGNYPILSNLSIAYLRQEPPLTERWLSQLEAHLRRQETVHTWRAMCHILQWLKFSENERAITFLADLFHRVPRLQSSVDGIRLLAHVQEWADQEFMRSRLEQLLTLGDPRAAQGAGELLVRQRCLFPDQEWAAVMLAHTVSWGVTAARVGAAHSIVRYWAEPQFRFLVHGHLIVLLKDQDSLVAKALGHIFHAGPFPTDLASSELIDTLAARPPVLRHKEIETIGHFLSDMVYAYPEKVFSVCQVLVDIAGENLGNSSSPGHLMSESLVSIALTLQDLGHPHQANGTALFERLLEINVPQANEMIRDLDKRTPQNGVRTPLPRRRTRRRA